MFNNMLDAFDSGTQPQETFYDGYVVNAIMDAAYRSAESKQWEPVVLEDWRGSDEAVAEVQQTDYDDAHFLVKEETMPEGRVKLILKQKASGRIVQRVLSPS